MLRHPDHIGIAVRDLDIATRCYETLLGVPPYKSETVVSESVRTVFFRTGDTKIELLSPLDDQGPIARFLLKHGEGIHHVAFEVEDILAEMERLRHAGFRLLQEEPRPGADDKLVCFLHPKDAHGVLVELCQSRKDR
ncbi:MAG: hypothetical protein RLY31_2532 [Bacteroidota bacterium]|jgi:methylmalonyl-CoA/ethylmalonyl-CoA epimerase